MGLKGLFFSFDPALKKLGFLLTVPKIKIRSHTYKEILSQDSSFKSDRNGGKGSAPPLEVQKPSGSRFECGVSSPVLISEIEITGKFSMIPPRLFDLADRHA